MKGPVRAFVGCAGVVPQGIGREYRRRFCLRGRVSFLEGTGSPGLASGCGVSVCACVVRLGTSATLSYDTGTSFGSDVRLIRITGRAGTLFYTRNGSKAFDCRLFERYPARSGSRWLHTSVPHTSHRWQAGTFPLKWALYRVWASCSLAVSVLMRAQRGYKNRRFTANVEMAYFSSSSTFVSDRCGVPCSG